MPRFVLVPRAGLGKPWTASNANKPASSWPLKQGPKKWSKHGCDKETLTNLLRRCDKSELTRWFAVKLPPLMSYESVVLVQDCGSLFSFANSGLLPGSPLTNNVEDVRRKRILVCSASSLTNQHCSKGARGTPTSSPRFSECPIAKLCSLSLTCWVNCSTVAPLFEHMQPAGVGQTGNFTFCIFQWKDACSKLCHSRMQ